MLGSKCAESFFLIVSFDSSPLSNESRDSHTITRDKDVDRHTSIVIRFVSLLMDTTMTFYDVLTTDYDKTMMSAAHSTPTPDRQKSTRKMTGGEANA